MPEPVSLAAIFTTSKLIEFAAGAIIGDQATRHSKSLAGQIRKALQNPSDQSKANEIVKVARIALLSATRDQALCLQESALSKDAKALKPIIQYLNKQIKAAEKGSWFRSATLEDHFKQLAQESTDHINTREALKLSILHELEHEEITVPESFKNTLENGCKSDWLEAIKKSFDYELAENTVASTFFQNDLLKTIEEKLKKLSNQIKEGFDDLKQWSKENAGMGIGKHLTVPPIAPEVFLGRDEELDKLKKGLWKSESNGSQIIVNGRGGIGKTSLASSFYLSHINDYDHLAWVSAANGISEGLLLLQEAFKLKFEKETEAQKLTVILQKLTNLKGLKLLVLDNANDAENLYNYYDNLRAINDLHLIVTSRVTNFRKEDTLSIKGLSEKDTITLFEQHYQPLNIEEKDLVKAIRKAVNENTLVIEIMAKNLSRVNRFGEKYSLQGLLTDLQEKGLLSLSHSKKVETHYQQLSKAEPEAIISAMYDLYGVPSNEQQLLKCISLLPNESIPFPYMKVMLEEIEDFEDGLAALADKGWIEHDCEGQSFKWSPVVQEVIRAKRNDLPKAAEILIKNLITLLNEEYVHRNNYIHAGHFVRYAENAANRLKAETSYQLGELWQNIGNYYEHTGDLTKRLEAFGIMEDLFTRLSVDTTDPEVQNGLAISYEKLGSTHSALGNLDQALKYFQQRADLGKQLFQENPDNVSFKNGLAISYSKLGSTHSALGNLEQALKLFKQYTDLRKQLYKDYPNNVSFKNGLAISYSKLGETHSALGNLEQALKYFEKDIELSQQLFQENPDNVSFKNGLAISYSKLGETHSALGNLEQALKLIKQYTDLRKQLYRDYPNNVSYKNGLAVSYAQLGLIKQKQLKAKSVACEDFLKAKTLWSELVEQAVGYKVFEGNLDWVNQELEELGCNETPPEN